ncbi:MAG: ferredoxin-like protein [Chloroflexota bacterium]
MHHTLRFYSRNRENILRVYMFLARWSRIPLIGGIVRFVGNRYGRNVEGGYLLSPAEAAAIVDEAEGVAVGPCTCREVFHQCDNPVNVELLLGPERHIFMRDMPADSREISKAEARAILEDCHRRGLVHSIIRCRHEFYAICNCCSCCCVPLRMKKQYGIGAALERHPDIVAEFRARRHTHTLPAPEAP